MSLTSLQHRLVKTGGRMIQHARRFDPGALSILRYENGIAAAYLIKN
ncbi:MAG: hypothetical protein GY953_13055 [bacterium]|nr:hypothetical protein [bacterium]